MLLFLEEMSKRIFASEISWPLKTDVEIEVEDEEDVDENEAPGAQADAEDIQ